MPPGVLNSSDLPGLNSWTQTGIVYWAGGRVPTLRVVERVTSASVLAKTAGGAASGAFTKLFSYQKSEIQAFMSPSPVTVLCQPPAAHVGFGQKVTCKSYAPGTANAILECRMPGPKVRTELTASLKPTCTAGGDLARHRRSRGAWPTGKAAKDSQACDFADFFEHAVSFARAL